MCVARTYGNVLLVEEWNGESRNGPPRRGGVAPRSTRTWTASYAITCLDSSFAEHGSLLPGPIAGDVLASPGPADEETGVAALSRLLERAGLLPDELRHGLDPPRVRDAGDRLRAVLEDRGHSRGLSLDVDRGRIAVSLEHGGRRVPVDRLPRDRRFRPHPRPPPRPPSPRKGIGAPCFLLDGPGRSFRREARARMRALFARYVRDGVTVIYTSRLPFRVELQHSEQVLVLAPAREGAMVDPSRRDPDSNMAVRAALGMTGRSSFTVDDLNLVVEGSSDARMLRALDELLQRSGREGLPPDVTLTGVQGAEDVAAVSTFLGRQGLGVVALFDSDGAGIAGYEHLREAARTGPRMERLELLQLDRAAGIERGGAAIEDLFPRDYYMEAVRSACDPEGDRLVVEVAEDSGGNPAARLSRAFEAHGRRFPKGKVIDLLAERLDEMSSVDELPRGMAARVRRLMEAIRSATSRLRHPPDRARGEA